MLTWMLVACQQAEPPDASRATLAAGPPDIPVPTMATAPMVQERPGLVINEVIAANDSQWQDPSNLDTPDWIELYNAGTEPIALEEVEVEAGSWEWDGKEGEIPPGGYFFLICDGVTDDANHAPFGINSLGERIELKVDGERVDLIETGVLYDDVVWARYPDAGAWLPSIHATPGFTNGSAPPYDSLDPRDSVFQKSHILRVDLFLTEGAIADLNSGGLFTETWVFGDIVVDGMQFPGSGVRLKGSGSYQDMNGKPNFKLDLNTAESDLRYRGLRAITLNSGNVYDPSRLHEYLAYRLARESGLAAPRVGWAKVYVNLEYYGIYQNVETWDEEFYQRWWPTQETGQLFEGSGCDFGGGGYLSCKYDEGPDVPDLSVLLALDEMVDGGAFGVAEEEIWDVLYKDRFLTYLAWEAVLDHWDGYKSPNNWRFFQDGLTNKLEWLPSGTDWTWAGSPDVYGGNGNVAELCFDMTNCKRDFNDYVVAVADVVEAINLEGDVTDLRDWLYDDIVADPRSGHSATDVQNVMEDTLRYVQDNPQDARDDVQ